MKVVNLLQMERFCAREVRARKALGVFVTTVRKARWRHFADLKGTFRSADKVGSCVVFDVGGNKYRVIATVDFVFQFVTIEAVLDHDEYDRERWKK